MLVSNSCAAEGFLTISFTVTFTATGAELSCIQIAESFRRFGITPTTTNLLIIKISTPSSPFTGPQVQEHLTEVVEGTQIAFSDDELREMVDLARVRKIYKLNTAGGGGKKAMNGANDRSEVDESRELEVLVLGSMALRGATN